MMNEVYGIWDTDKGGWLGHGGRIISGPEEVIQAVYRELIPEHEWFRADAQFVIAEFNAFGQPKEEAEGAA